MKILFVLLLSNYIIAQEYNHIAINQIKGWSSNYNLSYQSPGNYPLRWPGGKLAFKGIISNDHIIIGAKIDNEIKMIMDFNNRFPLSSGKILDNGIADNQSEKYRIYKILKGWETIPFGDERDRFEKDYNEWPVEDGAPWEDIDGDNIFTRGIDRPSYVGDEVMWYVSNDLKDSLSNTGLEFQVTIWAFNNTGILEDAVFKKIKIINKGNMQIDSIFIANMFYGLNYLGCDSTLNLSYTYSSTLNTPSWYSPAPAAGVILLKTPENLGMTAHNIYLNYFDTPINVNEPLFPFVPKDKNELYLTLQGKYWSGQPIINPHNGTSTKYYLHGNPYQETGWYMGEGWPGMQNYIFPFYHSITSVNITGPFSMATLDTQTIVIGTIMTQGEDNVHSVEELIKRAAIIKKAYELNFQLTPLPPQPKVTAFPQEDKVTLWWDSKAERYDEYDPFLSDQNYTDTTYTFEGYRVWQYRDSLGRDPRLIAIYDEQNGITVIEDNIIANGISVKAPIIYGNDEGLRRYINIEKDAFTGGKLYNGNPYYFGVTSYSYSPNSSPSYLESEKRIIEVIPGKDKIDYSSPFVNGSVLLASKTEGRANAEVIFKVIDPTALTGDEYEISLDATANDTLFYNLINLKTGDTLFYDNRDFTLDTLHKKITEGFMVIVNNIDGNSVDSLHRGKYGVRRVIETHGPGGEKLAEPINVFENVNSTGKWMIKTSGSTAFKEQNIDIFRQIGRDDYEIRFTNSGSEYYSSGYGSGSVLLKDDPKGKNKLPFELWNDDKGERLYIKIFDREVIDTSWTQNEATQDWERAYGFRKDIPYNEPIPASSGTIEQENLPLGNIVFSGELPQQGTVIKIETFKPLAKGDRYRAVLTKADFQNISEGKENIDKISVFPNPYYGGSAIERGGQSFVRFTGLPTDAVIRIYTIAGVFVRRIDKSSINQYVDWDLRNENGVNVASGIYIAHLEMPGIGEKILKVAVVMGKEYLR